MKTVEITLDELLIAFITTYCVMNNTDVDTFINKAMSDRVKKLGYNPVPINSMEYLW